ncbi:unnamed protein product, partial [Symbiodinium pilosum]
APNGMKSGSRMIACAILDGMKGFRTHGMMNGARMGLKSMAKNGMKKGPRVRANVMRNGTQMRLKGAGHMMKMRKLMPNGMRGRGRATPLGKRKLSWKILRARSWRRQRRTPRSSARRISRRSCVSLT